MDNRPKNLNEKLDEIELKIDNLNSKKSSVDSEDCDNLKKTIYSYPSLDQNKFCDEIKNSEKYFVYQDQNNFKQNRRHVVILNFIVVMCLLMQVGLLVLTKSKNVWVAVILGACCVVILIDLILIINFGERINYNKLINSKHFKCRIGDSGLPIEKVSLVVKLEWVYWVCVIFSFWSWILILNSGNLETIGVNEVVPFVLAFLNMILCRLSTSNYSSFMRAYNTVYLKNEESVYNYFIAQDRFIKVK